MNELEVGRTSPPPEETDSKASAEGSTATSQRWVREPNQPARPFRVFRNCWQSEQWILEPHERTLATIRKRKAGSTAKNLISAPSNTPLNYERFATLVFSIMSPPRKKSGPIVARVGKYRNRKTNTKISGGNRVQVQFDE